MRTRREKYRLPRPIEARQTSTILYPYHALSLIHISGTVEIWAKDFNVASDDNCTTKDKLRYSFGSDVTKPNRVITCADIPNGREALLLVEIYVHDLADNKDLCKVSLQVQDNSLSLIHI